MEEVFIVSVYTNTFDGNEHVKKDIVFGMEKVIELTYNMKSNQRVIIQQLKGTPDKYAKLLGRLMS
jgi:hypothetical protein